MFEVLAAPEGESRQKGMSGRRGDISHYAPVSTIIFAVEVMDFSWTDCPEVKEAAADGLAAILVGPSIPSNWTPIQGCLIVSHSAVIF